MKVGDTFVDGLYGHLWVVISDPDVDPNRVVIVNFTKHTTEKDEDCVIDPGEHQFAKVKTLIQFRDAKCVSVPILETLIKASKLTPHKQATLDLVTKIRAFACLYSNKLPKDCKSCLEDQGLVES